MAFRKFYNAFLYELNLYFSNLIICQSSSEPPIREFISKRYDNGLKELVLVFEGEGLNEVLVAKYGFYDDGLKKFIEPHEDNKLNGLSIYWHSNGQTAKEINYKDGKRNGSIKTFYDDGSPKVKGNFINDFEAGEFIVWNAYDGTREEFICKNGRKNGFYKKVNSDGNELVTGNYLDDERTGEWNFIEPFYFDGKKTTGRVQLTYKNDEPNGKVIFYHPNGKIQSRGNYFNGEKNDNWKFFNENGLIKSKGNYKKGYLDGEWEWFNEKGKLKTRINYKNSKKNGLRTDWNERDVKIFEGYYLNDKLEGKAKNWNEYGKLFSEGYYENNYKNGLWANYNFDSIIIEEILYKKGKIIERTNFSHYGNGNLKSKIFDKSDGINLEKYGSFMTSQEIIRTEINYFKNESIESISNYNYEDVKVGKWLKYSSNGSIDTALYYFDNSWFEKTGAYYSNQTNEVNKGVSFVDIVTAVQYDYWVFDNNFERAAFELIISKKKEKERKHKENLKKIDEEKFQSLIPLDKEIVSKVEKKLREIYIIPEFEIFSFFGFYEKNDPFDAFLERKNEFHQILKAKKTISIKDYESKDFSTFPLFMSEKNRKSTKWIDKNLFPVKSFSGKTKKDKRKKLPEAHVILIKDYLYD